MRKASEAAQLKVRLRDEIRKQLEAAAETAGRTLNGEIVERLEASLTADRSHGGNDQAALIREVVQVMEAASAVCKGPWWEDRVAWESTRNAIIFLLDRYEPTALPDLDESLSEASRAKIAEWKGFHGLTQGEMARREQELEDLEFKRSVVGLDQNEEARVEELKRVPALSGNIPDLTADEMHAWLAQQSAERRRARIWNRISPILQSAKARQARGKTK